MGWIRGVSRLTVTAVLLAALMVFSGGFAAGAVSQAEQTLSPGQAATLGNPGVSLRPLSDGRLRSYGVSVDVLGVAFVSQAGVSAPVAAAPGDELAVLHLATSWDLGVDNFQVVANDRVDLTVVSGAVSAPLIVRYNYPSVDDEVYAAAIPKDGPAVLRLSVGGLVSQSLDLRTGRRIGTAPTVLYRSQSKPTPHVQPSAVSAFNASSPAGTATGEFAVSDAYLSYWQPYTTMLASSPTECYLDVEFAPAKLSIPGYPDGSISPTVGLPAGSVRFVLADGRAVAATPLASGSSLIHLFSGDFYAQVPADVTTVKVIVTPGVLPVQAVDANYATKTVNVTFASPLTTTVTFPPPWTPPKAPPAAGNVAGGPTAPVGHSRSSEGWLIAVLAGAVMAAGLAGVAVLRRRRVLLPVRPAWPVPYPAAPPGVLNPGAATAVTARDARALPGGTAVGMPFGVAPFAQAAFPQAKPFDDAGPPTPVLAVRVLGGLEVDGLVKAVRRQSVRRLLVVLAVTPERAMGADELAMVISDSPDRDPKVASLHSYASILRSALPAGVLPDASSGGYRLDHTKVTVDWLGVAAVDAENHDSPGWDERAADALGLVRGEPLAGGAWEGVAPVVRYMQAAVERVARAVARSHISGGKAQRAEWAVTKGLLAVPGSVGLWEDRLDAAAAGSGYGLDRAWSDARSDLGADAALLSARYQHLRRQVAAGPATDT